MSDNTASPAQDKVYAACVDALKQVGAVQDRGDALVWATAEPGIEGQAIQIARQTLALEQVFVPDRQIQQAVLAIFNETRAARN